MLPARTAQHVSDTKALKTLIQQIPDTWLIRSLEERDYGVDLTLELFRKLPQTPKKKGERKDIKVAEPKGQYILLQIKGRDQKFGNGKLSSFPVKTMEYAELFQIPFFVVYVTLKDKQVHFLWLQQYIEQNLSSINWRNEEDFTLDFPKENLLDEDGIYKFESLVTQFYNEIELFNTFKQFFYIKEISEAFEAGGFKKGDLLREIELFIKDVKVQCSKKRKNPPKLQEIANDLNKKILSGWSTQSPQMTSWIKFIDYLKKQSFIDFSEEMDEWQKDDGSFDDDYKSLDELRQICEKARTNHKITQSEIDDLKNTLKRIPGLLLGCTEDFNQFEYPY